MTEDQNGNRKTIAVDNPDENFRARITTTFRALKHRNFQMFFFGKIYLSDRNVNAERRPQPAGLSINVKRRAAHKSLKRI